MDRATYAILPALGSYIFTASLFFIPYEMIHLILQLDVTVETPIKSAFRVKLNINKSDIQLARNTQTSRWIPNMSPEVSESSKVHVMLKIGRTLAGVSFGKEESVVDIDVQEAVQQLLASMQPEILVSSE
ncbi:hypothetical protein FRC16_003413 [Serendipita sp. 398]|nr:hypothetical protein FRC16_003413 [Serendipita sp. 398]